MSSPITYNPGPAASQIKRELGSRTPGDDSANTGAQRYALGYAMVVRVDYKQLTAVLRIETGETFETEVPLGFAGAGNRHFFGAIPEPGDVCVVGWKAMESGHSRMPVILNWSVPGVQAGYEWMPTQPYSPEEYGPSPSMRIRQEGIADRIRHKLRHMEPGNIVASSSQGSDLVLDESATLSNRRANEIRLRDSDQAIVFRSLQQFHAGAGFRIYGGMVQRDASFLPRQLFSDGLNWAPGKLIDESGELVFEGDLEASDKTRGSLSAHPVFDLGLEFPEGATPSSFLQRGMFISSDGYRRRPPLPDSGVYGGKVVYRVTDSPDITNAFRSTEADALTEYRLEVAHTTDGTLPVTEQTDNFDADRLPTSDPSTTTTDTRSGAAPFIEIVYGTVVGNDPFSLRGREVYGRPLAPSIFGAGENAAPSFQAGHPANIDGHAAMLFKMQPPGKTLPPTWWSVTKSGRALFSLAGPPSSWSAEGALSHGVRLEAGAAPSGESYRLEGQGGMSIATRGRLADNVGFEVNSDGGVLLVAEGPINTGRGTAGVGKATGRGESDQPAMHLKASTNLRLEAGDSVQIKAPIFDLSDVAKMSFNASAEVSTAAGTSIRQTSNTVETTTMGKRLLQASGPKDNKPSNGPYVHEIISTSTPTTGVVKLTEVDQGTTRHATDIGDVEVEVNQGDVSSKTSTGAVLNKAGENQWEAASSSGISGKATVGTVSIKATAGSTTISGSISARMSTQGTATVEGTAGVTLMGPGKSGLIISDADLDPLTGQPLSLYGMGSPGHRIA